MGSGASTPEPEIAMSEPLFGHDLLSILVEKGGACRLEDLRAASIAAHGVEAVYCNCGGDSFDFDGVIAFLGSKGKVQVSDGVITLGMAPACQH
jgi:probable metal-binding protein